MKRVLWLLLICLLTAVPVLTSCTQDVHEAPPKTETETTITAPPTTTESKPASFSVGGLTITPKEVTAGSSVTIEVLVSNTGELSGTYDLTLKIDNTVEDTEKVALNGGNSQRVTFTVTKSTAKTYSVSINGQSSTFIVQPVPIPLPPLDTFMKGICFSDWGWGLDKPRPPMYGTLYNPAQADVSLRNLATTGANWISVIVIGYQETISSTHITRNQYATASDEALEHVIDLAHSLGMRVTLAPCVSLSNDPDHWQGQIGMAFTTEDQWQDWFTSYREHINHYASFAQEAEVDLLYIGSELGGVTHREDDWRRIIKEVRDRFKGPISYDSLGGLHGDWKRIKWWDALDYIATDVWYPLTNKNDPTLAELKEAWVNKGYIADLENFSRQFNKPFIISEIGYQSADGTNTAPPAFQKFLQAPVDLQEQADCYQAALEALWGKPWLKGIFWWQWNAISTQWLEDPHGKPAEEVLKKFYLLQYPTQTPSATTTPPTSAPSVSTWTWWGPATFGKDYPATPGTMVTFADMKQTTTPEGKPAINLRPVAVGLPEDKVYYLWKKSLGQSSPTQLSPHEMSVTSDGSIIPKGSMTPISISFHSLAKGEAIVIALMTEDKSVVAYGKVIPYPIIANQGNSRIWVELMASTGEFFTVYGAGFEPNEELEITSNSAGEVAKFKSKTDANGRFTNLLLPAVVSKESGLVTYTVVAKAVTLTVSFEWGPPALRLGP
jgi:hypothetical protein